MSARGLRGPVASLAPAPGLALDISVQVLSVVTPLAAAPVSVRSSLVLGVLAHATQASFAITAALSRPSSRPSLPSRSVGLLSRQPGSVMSSGGGVLPVKQVCERL